MIITLRSGKDYEKNIICENIFEFRKGFHFQMSVLEQIISDFSEHGSPPRPLGVAFYFEENFSKFSVLKRCESTSKNVLLENSLAALNQVLKMGPLQVLQMIAIQGVLSCFWH
jgi:hypothetical protein